MKVPTIPPSEIPTYGYDSFDTKGQKVFPSPLSRIFVRVRELQATSKAKDNPDPMPLGLS